LKKKGETYFKGEDWLISGDHLKNTLFPVVIL